MKNILLILFTLTVFFSCSRTDNLEMSPIEENPCDDQQVFLIKYAALAMNAQYLEVWYIDSNGQEQHLVQNTSGSVLIDITAKEGDSIYIKAMSSGTPQINFYITREPIGTTWASDVCLSPGNNVCELGLRIPCF